MTGRRSSFRLAVAARVDRDELDAGLHQAADEMDVPGEAIEFGDDENGAMQAAEPKRFSDRGAVIALAALHLYDLLHKRPAAPVEKAGD